MCIFLQQAFYFSRILQASVRIFSLSVFTAKKKHKNWDRIISFLKLLKTKIAKKMPHESGTSLQFLKKEAFFELCDADFNFTHRENSAPLGV